MIAFSEKDMQHTSEKTPTMDSRTKDLPAHLEIRLATRLFYGVSCLAAFCLLLVFAFKICQSTQVGWMSLLGIPLGMICVDFLSGMIHWGADTWGSESMPILGKRLLHPFRVHHVNPADFLNRRFIDTNGDVAFLTIPGLVTALFLRIESPVSAFVAIFIAAFCGVGLMTNQIHQWAHMRTPPMPIRLLQQTGLILSHEQHEMHHRPPHVDNYCITTGWCNRPLQAISFFSRLEKIITRITGLQPRYDETAFTDALSDKETSK
ncbi:MAG: fatty acid desaturase CarF family protein [Planctomycetota bacterium]|nr:fatty acid desaturase CarF family protein [Planctomycetota bacterium]